MDRKYNNVCILLLTFFSGICGLAYELLFSRVLTAYLGDMYYVNAAILISFLLGLGIAAFLSHRFVKWLWLIELVIGMYALGFSFLWSQFGFLISSNLKDATALLQFQSVFICFVIIFPAAFLIGMCVPIYTHYLEEIRKSSDESRSFEFVYIFYNLGAAACVLLVEFWLIRVGGIKCTIQLMALFNIGIGIILKCWTTQLMQIQPLKLTFRGLSPNIQKDFWALFLISVISGISQLVYLKYIYLFWGPQQENFALHLAVVLIGISVGTFLVNKLKVKMPLLILLAPILLVFSFWMIPLIVHEWTVSNIKFTDPLAYRNIKGILIFKMLIIPMVVFGALVPSIHRHMKEFKNRTGGILAISSLGNCLGFILTIFFLFEYIPYEKMPIFICFGLIILGFVFCRLNRYIKIIILLFSCVLLTVMASFFPSKIFHLGAFIIGDQSSFQYYTERMQSYESYRKYDRTVDIINYDNHSKLLIINGYHSISVQEGETAVSEFLFGVGEAMFSQKRDKALVLGIGAGVTTAAVSLLYKDVTAVEINPIIIDLLPSFKEHNFDIVNRSNFNIVNDDGMSFLMRNDTKYDLIMNNVPLPILFSAGKLWTKEALELAKSRLAPGGVYSLWISPTRGRLQSEIISNTVASAFKHCYFFMISGGFGKLICSDEPIRPRILGDNQWPEPVTAFIKSFDTPINKVMSYLTFETNTNVANHQDKRINTIDSPILEFIMTSYYAAEQNRLSLLDVLGIEIDKSAFTGALLTEEEVTQRCRFLSSVGFVSQAKSFIEVCNDKLK